MSEYIIEGNKKLIGEVKVSGAKNAALPILAATILNRKTTTLYNVPEIEDTKITLEILSILGCKVSRKSGKIIINTEEIKNTEIPHELMKKLRSSVILVGALLGRFNEVTFSCPGGCEIGARPIDLHLSAFEKLGVKIDNESGYIKCKTEGLIGAEILLDFPSVGATENIMMAATLAKGITIIKNAAMEPEIVDLQNFLNRMGAKIIGAGTNLIQITGVQNLQDVSYNIMPDRIETGTLMCMAAITSGKVTIKNVMPESLTPAIVKLEECGCKIEVYKDSLLVQGPKRLKAIEIKTMPYPGFPTDLQSVFACMLTLAKGTSIIVENIFENRFKYVTELRKMGAKVNIEGKMAVINGVRKLSPSNVVATDLRSGAGLVIVALATKGVTTITQIEHILRGYENLDKKLQALGANIIQK